MIGQTIAHYKLVDKLGEGGMGIVYLAEDLHLDRLVAVKLLPPERVADEERRKRFVQEAKAASALNHSNIITIYDIATADGVSYMAMDTSAAGRCSTSSPMGAPRSARRFTTACRSRTPWPSHTTPGSSIATSSRPTSWSLPAAS